MENLFYRSSTRVLTSRGMITFDEVNESDDLFYINCDGELSKTNNFHLLKVVSSEINYISGKHLNIEYTGNFTSYKNENRLEEFNMNRPFNLKIANLYDYEKKEFDKDSTNILIDLNGKTYGVSNIKGLIFSYILESFYTLKEETFTQNKTIDSHLLYSILSGFKEYTGLWVRMNSKDIVYTNKSSYAVERYCLENSKITKYFLKNLDYLQDFLDTLIDIHIIKSFSEGKYEMYFGKYKLAADFQALISLLGYKTLLKYNKVKNVFVVLFFNLTNSLTTKPLKSENLSLTHEEEFYNIYIFNEEPVKLITQCTNNRQESCIYYGVSAIKDEDTSYNNLGDDE